ncbi:MAG: DUF2339 domain-containing protein [Syntrophomonas sp.]
MENDEQKQLDLILAELADLKARMAELETRFEQTSSRTASVSRPAIVQTPIAKTAARAESTSSQSLPRIGAHLSENFIGGKLLNRIGALIVIFAVAYFLKWSFDNDFIGELGRCVLGLAGGAAFMLAGQFYLKKGYSVFAQGMTGAGIAIIYLSSYAAVNYYHLISPYAAFALMFITALVSGVLSALENMPGTAVMATLGGFLVPFLMGSHSGEIVPLLSYVLVLDLGILFLAYYRRWLFLDVLALAGTGIISIVAFNMHWRVWYGQVFLIAYFILFMGVALIYHKQTRRDNLSLLLVNSLFFSAFSYINLLERLNNWLGLIGLGFAAAYISLYLFLGTRGKLTPLFAKALLTLGLIFALLTAPSQLDGVYCRMAWLAAAGVLLYLCDLVKSKPAFFIASVIVAATFTSVFDTQVMYPTPVLNQSSLIITLCILGWCGALLVNQRNYPQRRWQSLTLLIFIVATLFYLLAFDINNAIYYYQANQSFSFLIPVSWALVSSILLWLGVRRDNISIRMFSLLLFGIVIIRTLFYDLQQLDIAFKIMVLLAIGLISLAISFFYQKRMKGDSLP